MTRFRKPCPDPVGRNKRRNERRKLAEWLSARRKEKTRLGQLMAEVNQRR